MKKYMIFLLFICVNVLIAKPSIGIIRLDVKDPILKNQAKEIYDYLSFVSTTLKNDYSVTESTMALDELILVTGCAENNLSCMYNIALSMKVDFLVYGLIKKETNKTYKIILSKLDVKTKEVTNNEFIGKTDVPKEYAPKINIALSNMFPITKIALIENNSILLKVKSYDSNKKNIIADFYLDGKLIGKTPIKLSSSKTTTGKHVIMLKAKGYDTIKQDIELIDGETQVLPLTLSLVTNPANRKTIGGKSNDLNNKEAWYQNWKVQAGIGAGVVVVVTVVAIILLSGNDTENSGTLTTVDLPALY